MRIHHLSCGTMCPYGGRLVSGDPEERPRLVCHCLLIETDRTLVLVDSGIGLDDCRDPSRFGPARFLLDARFDARETAHRRVAALGFDPRDVRHVVVTHLDVDHAGGLPDFPSARVHCMRRERDAALEPSLRERMRYRAVHFAHGPDFRVYDVDGDSFLGFDAVRELEGLPPEILLLPLDGHTKGHAAVVVDTGKGHLVHAGDAYFFRGEMDPERPSCPPALAAFQTVVADDDVVRRRNQGRLRQLVRDHASEVRVFCAHDPYELAAFAAEASAA